MNTFRTLGRTTLLLLAFWSLSALLAQAAPQLDYLSDELVIETANKKMWQSKRSRRFKQPEDVEEYLRELNAKGEYSDWRLPTKQELYNLQSIFDLKNNGPVKIRIEGTYWYRDDTSTPQVGSWEIGDQCGPSRTFYSGKAGVVRAVRP